MTPAELRASVTKTPFRPFRINRFFGQGVVCSDPVHWCIAPSGSFLMVHEYGREPYTMINAADIESVECPWEPEDPLTQGKRHSYAHPLPEPERVYRFTVEQYEEMTRCGILDKYEKVELIEGVVVFKNGYP